MQRELAEVTGAEQVGAYTLLRVQRGKIEPGIPGQFFMLEAPGRPLPRPMSLCLAPPAELAFLIDPIGPGTRALCTLRPGDRLAILGPLGTGYRLDVERPLLVGGGIGIAPLPYLSDTLGHPPAVLGFRSELHAQAARLVPNAEVVLEPTAQLAWEAPMACGYGACYGCAVEIDGELRRLCVEGPVLSAGAERTSDRVLANASGAQDGSA